MKLNRREVEVLDFLVEKSANVSSVAQALGVKKPNLIKYVRKLVGYGLVSARKEGRNRILALDTALAMRFSRIKNAIPGIGLNEILVGKTPFLLACEKANTTFRLADLDLPPMTAKRLLIKLRKLGIVSMPKKGEYRIREEARALREFSKDFLMDVHLAEAQGELGRIERAVYSFSSAREVGAVFVTTEEAKPKHYWPTAYSLFENYGLQLIHAGKYYYSNTKPDLGDVVIHTLALSKDARAAAYAAFLILKNRYDPRLLLRKKQLFGLSREYIWELIEFIESRGKKPFEGLTFEEVEGMMHGKL